MISAMDTGLSGLGSSTPEVVQVLSLDKTLILSVTQVGKWVTANLILVGNTAMDYIQSNL